MLCLFLTEAIGRNLMPPYIGYSVSKVGTYICTGWPRVFFYTGVVTPLQK